MSLIDSKAINEIKKAINPIAKKIGIGGEFLFKKAVIEATVQGKIHLLWTGFWVICLLVSFLFVGFSNLGGWEYLGFVFSFGFSIGIFTQIDSYMNNALNPEWTAFCFLMNRFAGRNQDDNG